MKAFKYTPIDLEGPTFRLVILRKGNGPEIECDLFDAWLHERGIVIPYEALSYTWGDIDMVKSITINGRKLDVTKNLYMALWHLRFPVEDRVLWIDTICIDQTNKDERSHQVRQMANIYNQADLVIFWLGEATHETDVLMDSLELMQLESVNHPCRNWNTSDERWLELWLAVQPTLKKRHSDLATDQLLGLEFLLGQSWFKRVWILQEVAGAKAAVVCCGTKRVAARIFGLAPSLIGAIPSPHCQAVLDIMSGPSRQYSWWSRERYLYTLLRKFQGSHSTEPRDMIYALLGMSSDARQIDYLAPDYNKSD